MQISMLKNMLKEIDGPMCAAMDHGLTYFETFYKTNHTEIKYPKELLAYAISRGYVDIVQYLVSCGFEIKEVHIREALYPHKPEMMRIFCDKNPSIRFFEAYDILSTKSLDECTVYIASLGSLHGPIDEFYIPPMELIIILGRLDILQYIVTHDEKGANALHRLAYYTCAIEAKQKEILYYFSYLDISNADDELDIEDDEFDIEKAVYMIAPALAGGCAEILDKVTFPAETYSTFLYNVVQGYDNLLKKTRKPSLELLKKLVEEYDASPSVVVPQEGPLLFYVIAQGSSDIVQYFFDLSVANGSLFNDRDKKILHYAIQSSKQLQCLSLLSAYFLNGDARPSENAWRKEMLQWISGAIRKETIVELLGHDYFWLRYDLETLREFYKYLDNSDLKIIALNCLTMLDSEKLLFDGFGEKSITSYVEKIQYLLAFLSPDAYRSLNIRLHPMLIRWESRKGFLSSIDCFHKASSSASGEASAAAADETGLKELLHDWRLTGKISGKLNHSLPVGKITSFFYNASALHADEEDLEATLYNFGNNA